MSNFKISDVISDPIPCEGPDEVKYLIDKIVKSSDRVNITIMGYNHAEMSLTLGDAHISEEECVMGHSVVMFNDAQTANAVHDQLIDEAFGLNVLLSEVDQAIVTLGFDMAARQLVTLDIDPQHPTGAGDIVDN